MGFHNQHHQEGVEVHVAEALEAEAAMPEDSFSLQSQKKDIMATARRFTLGIQD